MKNLVLLGALVLGLSSVSKAQVVAPVATISASTSAADANKADFKFEKEVHDFGTVSEGPAAAYEFKFTNTGKQPLIITNVVASCGCTTPQWSKEPVVAGKTGSILVSFDTNGRPGGFNKAVTVSSNSKTPIKVLYIKGVVEKKK